MLILVFGAVCAATGALVLVLTLFFAVYNPLVALVVLGPLLLGAFWWLHALYGRVRLRNALRILELERYSKFRRY